MREFFNGVDLVGRSMSLNQATPSIICKSDKPMERGKNGARYFRNPPQPHMCIQDYVLGSKEPCFINVLSWIKISTPRRPEDPIPLYGGMRIPFNSLSASSYANDKKRHPIIYAVMANPEILRLSGKTAQDPLDRDALVDLMIDFVEAMNPEIKFKRQFTVLKDRDLTGELKDIWLAIQVKREREKEKAESGKKLESAEKQKDTKVGVSTKESVSYWFEMYRNRKSDSEDKPQQYDNLASSSEASRKDFEEKNQTHDCKSLLSSSEIKSQINSVIEGPMNPSPKNSPTHQRKSKIRSSSKGELLSQTVQHFGKKAGGDSNVDVHVTEVCTVTKHTVFKEIFPSSSDSSEDEDRGDIRLNNVVAGSSQTNDGNITMNGNGTSDLLSNNTNKAATMENACSSENSDSEPQGKQFKLLRVKHSSLKNTNDKQGGQSVHIANKHFKNHDKKDSENVARFQDCDC